MKTTAIKFSLPLVFGLWAASVPAQEPCAPQTLADCQNASFEYGLPTTTSGVEAIATIRDSNGDGNINASDASWQLYQRIIAPRFEMPDEPRLRFIFNDLRLATEAPVVQDLGALEYDSRYLEYGVELLVRYGPHEHWRDVRLILNNRAGFETGRSGKDPKLLGELVYEQNPRPRIEGFATAWVGDEFFMRADWRPVAAEGHVYDDPSPNARLTDYSEDGDPWGGEVAIFHLNSLPAIPIEFITGQGSPTGDNPTSIGQLQTVMVRVRLNPNIDLFNVADPSREAISDADPLPDLFDEAAGESLDTIVDVDAEWPGVQYGPAQQFLLAESQNVTDDGPCGNGNQAACE